jgi:hypothetical protein
MPMVYDGPNDLQRQVQPPGLGSQGEPEASRDSAAAQYLASGSYFLRAYPIAARAAAEIDSILASVDGTQLLNTVRGTVEAAVGALLGAEPQLASGAQNDAFTAAYASAWNSFFAFAFSTEADPADLTTLLVWLRLLQAARLLDTDSNPSLTVADWRRLRPAIPASFFAHGSALWEGGLLTAATEPKQPNTGEVARLQSLVSELKNAERALNVILYRRATASAPVTPAERAAEATAAAVAAPPAALSRQEPTGRQRPTRISGAIVFGTSDPWTLSQKDFEGADAIRRTVEALGLPVEGAFAPDLITAVREQLAAALADLDAAQQSVSPFDGLVAFSRSRPSL